MHHQDNIKLKKSWKSHKIIWISLLAVILSVGFLSFDESRDFKLVKNVEVFSNLLRELNYFYVDNPDPEKLIKTGIDAMLKTLDPYTVFIPEADMASFKFMTTGQYGGIGSLIRKSGDYIVISEVYKGFPADLAGIIPGDLILSIGGKSIKGFSPSQVSALLKGKPNSEVKVTLKRYGEEKPLSKIIYRKEVHVPNVPYYGMLDHDIGYIRLSGFTTDASKEVKSALENLKNSHQAKSIVFDLRGNPGGLLIEAVKIVNLFVPKGQEIVSTKGKVKNFDHIYLAPKQPDDTQIPLALLVDRGSASAAEIVSGAIQDLDRGVILGERTFGKGLVQTTRPLGYNNQLKVTTAKYYIPSGRCIQALDYKHRNADGSVGHIPDSLISKFKTHNGRTVFDGGGIVPDVKVKASQAGLITLNLYAQNLIFDYANRFVHLHDSIAPVSTFEFTDKDYANFVSFVKEKQFSYSNPLERRIQELIKEAKKEKLYEANKTKLEDLKKDFLPSLDAELEKNKEDIKQLLTIEITGRYYYQAGRIESSLNWDEDLKKAEVILSDQKQYASILNATSNSEKPLAITH